MKFIIFLFSLISGCASTPQTNALLNNHQDLLLNHQIQNVPFVPQSENSCGPASLATIAQFYGKKVSIEELTPMMITPAKKGTLTTEMLRASRRIGLIAVLTNSLRKIFLEVTSDHPVIILQNFGSTANPIWHYSVLIGYDITNEEVTVNSGLNQNLKINFTQFERAWKYSDNWALISTRPDLLPVTTSPAELLSAASALENSNKTFDAKTAYLAILKKWPDLAGAWFGLGNTYAKLNNWRESSNAFKAAVRLEPDSAVIQNNLLYALRKLKQLKHQKAR